MEARTPQLPPQPPGAVNALMSGFNAVANNVGVILFPIALDLLLWLGPRLKMSDLLAPALQFIEETQRSSGQILPFSDFLDEFIEGFNLFSNLRSFPVGVFSLMRTNLSAISPLGQRLDVEISNWFVVMGIGVGLTLIGCLLGSLYFYSVSRAALQSETPPGLFHTLFHSLLLAGVWQFVLIGALPFLAIFLVLPGTFLGIFLFVLLAWPVTWLALMIFFSAHGVFVQAQNAFASLSQIFRMLRYGLPPLGWFALTALVISQGLDLLWRVAPAESWMTLVGIFGHAFVSTSLLAASFIFYRDMNSWVEAALEWIKTHQITSARA